jgi:hypothetical protein
MSTYANNTQHTVHVHTHTDKWWSSTSQINKRHATTHTHTHTFDTMVESERFFLHICTCSECLTLCGYFLLVQRTAIIGLCKATISHVYFMCINYCLSFLHHLFHTPELFSHHDSIGLLLFGKKLVEIMKAAYEYIDRWWGNGVKRIVHLHHLSIKERKENQKKREISPKQTKK